MAKPVSYADAGVSIDTANEAVAIINVKVIDITDNLIFMISPHSGLNLCING